jgi:hypothetical protein
MYSTPKYIETITNSSRIFFKAMFVIKFSKHPCIVILEANEGGEWSPVQEA